MSTFGINWEDRFNLIVKESIKNRNLNYSIEELIRLDDYSGQFTKEEIEAFAKNIITKNK